MDNPYGVYRFDPAKVFQVGNSMTNYVGVSNKSDKNNIFLSFENNVQQGVVQYREVCPPEFQIQYRSGNYTLVKNKCIKSVYQQKNSTAFWYFL